MPKQAKKQIWFTVEEIPNNNHFMMGFPARGFVSVWPKLGLGDKLEHYFTKFQDGMSCMCFPRDEFNRGADFLANKSLKDPAWAIRILKNVEHHSRQFMSLSKKLYAKKDLKPYSNKELAHILEDIYPDHEYQHVVGASISWLADAEGERLSRAIIKSIDHRIKELGLKLVAAEVFSILTTPLSESFSEKEEKEFLDITQRICQSKSARRLFADTSLARIELNLSSLPKKLAGDINKHYQKWRWLPYMYVGPPYQMQEFLVRWQGLIKQKNQVAKMVNEAKQKKRKIDQEQKRILAKLKPDSKTRLQIKLVQYIVFIKGFRKDALYYGMYCYEPIFREISQRLLITIDQLRQLAPWEITEALRNNKVDQNNLNERKKFAVSYVTKNGIETLTGQRAWNFINKLEFEKVKTDNIEELSGTCACPGKARGQARIVNVPEEMSRMKKGDILVSHTTNPNIVPAMKKAAAIVTNSGGVTCHAAVVSRELKIPCVVGTKIATRALKDGDLIEVDATKGLVNKI